MRPISGQKEPVIRLVRQLQSPSGRRRQGRYVIEGAELISRAFRWGAEVEALLLTEGFAASEEGAALAAASPVGARTLTRGLMGKIVQGAKPTPEAIAVAARRTASLDELFAGEAPLLAAVDHGELADNLGMLLRTVEACGMDGVCLSGDTVEAFGRRVVRGARGATFRLNIHESEGDLSDVYDAAAARGVQIVATTVDTQGAYTDVDYTKPTVIVVGNEHRGVGELTLERATHIVKIPMLGQINSLNISVAASIMYYEAVRQRLAAG
jgi:TrmH family RNA methyltransferase